MITHTSLDLSLISSIEKLTIFIINYKDHVYLRHLSTEYRSTLSADMSTDSRPICRPSIGRYVGRVSVDMLFELIDCRSVCRSTLGRHVGRYVAGVSVDCRWYRSIVNRCFVEIAAVSLPTGDAKEDSIPYARVLIERRCSSNCRHFEYISNQGHPTRM